MNKTVYQIDQNGFFLLDVHLQKDKPVPSDCVIIPPVGLFKPRWDGEKWFEGATQEYIEELTTPIPQELSEIDKLRLEQAQANTELVQLIMMMSGGMA